MKNSACIGVIGCGNISDAYFRANQLFSFFDIKACADLDLERAKAKAQQWNIPHAMTVEDLLRDDDIALVINLTIPKAHAPVMLDCLDAGKSVYTEKPFALTRDEALSVVERARQKALRVGSAPDTFLGGAHQTARKLIDDGAIGVPVSATAFMQGPGHEHWHPSPEFYYKPGGGPMLDMGPYYITDLVQLLGPARQVTGMSRITYPERTISSEPLKGTKMKVEVPTHVSGVIEFVNNAIATLIMSFDVFGHNLPCVEIHGTEGSLFVPDPNGFGGTVRLKRDRGEVEEIPLTHGYTENSRGLGMADMTLAIQQGRDHRCNERLALHVLDIMQAFQESSDSGKHIPLSTTCDRPEPLPPGLEAGQLEAGA